MSYPALDRLDWGSVRESDGENIVISFSGISPRHIAIIPREVLEDGLRTTNEAPIRSAEAHKAEVMSAIAKALEERDWRELVNIDTGETLFQLWIMRRHF